MGKELVSLMTEVIDLDPSDRQRRNEAVSLQVVSGGFSPRNLGKVDVR